MATDLDELIRWWKDYLATQFPILTSQVRDKIRATITILERLNKLQEGE